MQIKCIACWLLRVTKDLTTSNHLNRIVYTITNIKCAHCCLQLILVTLIPCFSQRLLERRGQIKINGNVYWTVCRPLSAPYSDFVGPCAFCPSNETPKCQIIKVNGAAPWNARQLCGVLCRIDADRVRWKVGEMSVCVDLVSEERISIGKHIYATNVIGGLRNVTFYVSFSYVRLTYGIHYLLLSHTIYCYVFR